jgi:hypothetical protein
MLCFNKDAGLASRWSGLPGLQVMHLYLTILDIHNNLTIDKWAAGLIDGGGRTVSDGVPDKGLYDKCARV